MLGGAMTSLWVGCWRGLVPSVYSPECVEGVFSKVRRHGVLGSSLGCAGEYDVLVTWATRGEGPSCRQKRTRP